MLSLATLATASCLTVGTASASAAGLTGAGSTLIAPLMAQWTQDYQQRTGTSVTYGAVGSGAGIAQITGRTVDFGASDAPLSAAQAAACNGCVQIPWGLTGVAIGFNLPGIRNLHLSGPVVADIFLGRITNWSAPQIRAMNKGVRLPNLKITPTFRSDGSGDTYAFTDYLSSVSRTWATSVGNSTSVTFPTGVGGKGNSGVTAVVSSTPGAIGYISASYIIANVNHVSAAAMKNAYGAYEYPNIKNIENAAQSVKRVPSSNEMHIVNPSKTYHIAYPLATFTYVIVPRASKQKAELSRFISYALGAGQSFGLALDFAPIPGVVRTAGSNTLKLFTQG